MSVIKDFFLSIGSVIKSLVDIVIDFVKDTVYVVKLSKDFLERIPELFSFMPVKILSIITLIFSIVVIYKVLGRD